MSEPDATLEPLLTVREVAAAMRVERNFIYRGIAAGEIECVKLGPKAFRVRPSAIRTWLDSKTTTTAQHVQD